MASASSLILSPSLQLVSGKALRRNACLNGASLKGLRGIVIPRRKRVTALRTGSHWEGFRCRAGAEEDVTVESDERPSAESEMSPPAESEARPMMPLFEERSGALPTGWQTVGFALFGLGFLIGPPLDAIHSRVHLQVYDNGAINLFGLETNIWVPPMLGLFYSSAGLLQLVLDKKYAPRGQAPTASLTTVSASFLSLAALLELSAEMYAAGVPFNIESYVLFFGAEVNWLLFENTWWGFALAALVGVACPLAEIPIEKLFGLWHYPNPNVSIFGEGSVSWVICCYFFYTPFISNLARWLSSYQKQAEHLEQ